MRFLVTILLTLIGLVGSPQQSKTIPKLFEKARVAFLNKDYPAAIKNAYQILNIDKNHNDSRLLLSEIYHNLDSARLEIEQLKYVFSDSTNKNSLVGYRLAQAYLKSGNYKQCLGILEQALNDGSIPPDRKNRMLFMVECCRFAVESIANPVAADAVKVGEGIDTENDEYWPALSIDGNMLVFTRLLGGNTLGAYKQEDFYVSTFTNGVWEAAKPLAEINTVENEGAQALSADGKLMFFSACNRADGLGSCDIYFTRFDGQQWAKPRNAGPPVCSASWESQPSFASNSRYLYFASNRPGGKGGMDIWRCRFSGFDPNGNPEWGKPENLGDSLNTLGNELSPFIHFNETDFYFSSDSRIGMGGKDIFHARLKPDFSFGEAENQGFPINSHNDEQGFVIGPSGQKAYFASNADGNMDIYSLDLVEKVRPAAVTYIKGKVMDSTNRQPLQAEVELRHNSGNRVDSIKSDNNGEFLVPLPLGGSYGFNVSKKGYLFYSQFYEFKDISEADDPLVLEILLHPVAEGSRFVLNNIYFETNSSELLPGSKPELEKLLSLLTENPGITIEIEGHTDNTGGEEFNQVLSENRAKAVNDFLVDEGINQSRLTYKGFGFNQPVAPNDTDEGKRQNRRTEIKVVEVKTK